MPPRRPPSASSSRRGPELLVLAAGGGGPWTLMGSLKFVFEGKTPDKHDKYKRRLQFLPSLENSVCNFCQFTIYD